MVSKFDKTTLGPSQRQLRVGELIRRALSALLFTEASHDPELNRLSITVGEVTTSTDLKIATAYVCPLGGREGDNAVSLLARNKTEIRRAISKELTLKYVPDLRFRLDETYDRLEETKRLFNLEKVKKDLDV